MEKAKLFMNGGSQAVRLPKDYRFEGEEVLIRRIGSTVMLSSVKSPLEAMLEAKDGFTEDFLKMEADDLPLQEREGL